MGWTISALVLSRHAVTHNALAISAAAVAFAFCVASSVDAWRLKQHRQVIGFTIADVAIGLMLMTIDGYAFTTGHVFGAGQTLTASWPMVAALATGFSLGMGWGAGAGFILGLGRVVGGYANARWHNLGIDWADVAAGVTLYTASGAVGGWVLTLLRRSDEALASSLAAQAALAERHNVASRLHDTVLQTLAVVARRGDDDVADLARRTDRELRAFLFSDDASACELLAGFKSVAAEVSQRFDRDITTSFGGGIDDRPTSPDARNAVLGATREALSNACKHAAASSINLFAQRTDRNGLFVSIRDDGTGFETGAVEQGHGLQHSIRERIAAVGGTVIIETEPGAGTDVQMSLP